MELLVIKKIMEDSFETILSVGEQNYHALIAYKETDTESFYKILYKKEHSSAEPDVIEINFIVDNKDQEKSVWKQRENNPYYRTDITPEFLESIGQKIENHFDSIA
jgi:hypothetical protein